MAESFLFGRVDNILSKLTSLVVEEFWLAWRLEAQLHKLKTTLSSIKAVVLDAEEQASSNRRVSIWLNQLRDVLYDAEDMLDEVAYEASRKQWLDTSQADGIIKRKVRTFFSSSNPIAYRIRISHKMKQMRLRLDEIAVQKDQFSLADRLDNYTPFPLRKREMTHSFVKTSDVIGRDEERDTVVAFLLNSEEGHDSDHVSVLPIVGIGGLGKTALAQMVFNDSRVVGHFDKQLWVCLGDAKQFSVNQALLKVFKAIQGERTVDTSNPEYLQTVIQNELRGKKFLLILDDMWDVNRDKWLELGALLACGAKGSKIVVTTRIKSVATCVGTVSWINLKGLAHEKCVSLFKKLAFASEDEVDDNLMKVGQDIVKKCKGIPLVVRSLGSMLFSKSDEKEWLIVRDSDIWQIDENRNGILSILEFSYDRLPSNLKQCFVYCSIFPEDYLFTDHSLISFWMAHGLLQSSKTSQEPEYVGKQYIKELFSRGFFQDFEDDGFECKFKMHDLLRDLARSLGQEEFITVTKNEKCISGNARHLYFEKEQDFSCSSDNVIRTVIVGAQVSTEFVESCISHFKHLRVFWLVDPTWSFGSLELPTSIGTSKHLKSLNLISSTSISMLPDSISKLHSLQYLSLNKCDKIEEIPQSIRELINLRFLWIITRQNYLPKNGIGTGSITSILSLDMRVRRGHDDPSNLLQLSNLRSLKLELLPKFQGLPEWIQDHAHTLQYLELSHCYYLKVLPEWFSNLTSLTTLKIQGCFRLLFLPRQMQRLTSLKEVRIVGCGELSRRCDRRRGAEDWPLIAHVPSILIK